MWWRWGSSASTTSVWSQLDDVTRRWAHAACQHFHMTFNLLAVIVMSEQVWLEATLCGYVLQPKQSSCCFLLLFICFCFSIKIPFWWQLYGSPKQPNIFFLPFSWGNRDIIQFQFQHLHWDHMAPDKCVNIVSQPSNVKNVTPSIIFLDKEMLLHTSYIYNATHS